MPRKAKENDELTEINKATKKTSTKKITTPSKETKKIANKEGSIAEKTSKQSTKKSSSKSTTKVTTKKKSASKSKKTNPIEIVEYYDLPYRYNETIVKVLAQTPNILFVYWDISDKDKEKYINQFGEYFFNNTKPVLIIKNETLNYEYEIDINDFANSWYLKIKDTKCKYNVQLGRRPINKYVSIPNNYLYITKSNNIESPNDHILLEKLPNTIYFKNIKTNELIPKNISSISSLVKFEELYKSQEYNMKYTNPTSTFK